ncbi:Bug family tripartite tricarboxylate transporter substrate binding protein [Cupriavidus necator]
MTRIKALLLCVCTILAPLGEALADTYPSRPLTLVVPYSPGTGLDTLARAISTAVSPKIGQPIVVENRPGAGTNIGVSYAARAKPDGYTIVIGANSAFAANKSLYTHLNFDPVGDLEPIAFLGKGAMVVLTNQSSNVKSMADLVKYAKEHPGKTNIGAANTTARVWVELIKSMAGIQAETIVYNNAGGMLTDLMGGQVNFAVENTGTSRSLVSSNKLKPLAVTSKARGKFNATVPTLTEANLGQYEVDTWFAIFAPKGTPQPIIDRLNKEINSALTSPEVVKATDIMELSGGGGSPQQLRNFQVSEIEKWRKLVDKTGIKLD